MAEKRKEVWPTVIGRRKVEIPHYASGGLFMGLPAYADGGAVNPIAVNGGQINQPTTSPSGTTNPTMEMDPNQLHQNLQNMSNDPAASVANVANPMSSVNSGAQMAGGALKDIANAFVTQNNYQAGLANTQTSDYSGAINGGLANALSGYNNFNNNQSQQQQLNTALQAQANGTGVNPAQKMLANSTGTNVANQSAMMAGQRGAGANAGMIARQAAMAGSGIQQNAAGQAAALQAQQSSNALGQQAQVLGQMGSQGIQEQQANNQLFSSGATAQNQQNMGAIENLGMAQGINSQIAQANANASNQAVGGMMNTLGGGAVTSALNKGGVVGKDGTKVLPRHFAHVHSLYHADNYDYGGMVPTISANAINPFLIGGKGGGGKPKSSGDSGDGSSGAADGAVSGAEDADAAEAAGAGSGAIEGAMMLADGGNVPDLSGNDSNPFAPPQKSGGGGLGGLAMLAFLDKGGEAGIASDFKGVQAKIGNWATNGETSLQMGADRVNADPRNSAVETALPDQAKMVAAPDYRSGGPVPGQARVAGDSLKNDIQPAMLSPKEIVLPRSITMAPDAPEKAREFVAALMKKQGHGNSNHHKEFHKALKDAILSRKKKSGGRDA